MTPSARLQAVLELLTAIDATPRPADAIVSAYFRARRYIGSKDRAYVSTRLYDILRHHARLGWWLERAGADPSPRARLLAYLTLVEQMEPKIVDELFSGGKFAAAARSDEERVWLRTLSGHSVEHPDMPDIVLGECPAWAEEGLKRRFGKNLVRELRALLQPAPLDLRVNPLKAEREAMLAAIKKAGLKAELCHISPLGIRVEERPSLNSLPMLREGEIEIQDEGSQMVAFLVGAKPGERVVDFCAGAGGKTLAIAAAMKNKGRIVACDVLANRLKRSGERFRRAGLHNIEIKPLASENDAWVKRHKAGFDRVLVDAPCSGTGTWRRNPDSRWKNLGPGLDNLVKLQASILASASRLVKPGGRLVYATCSLLAEENEVQIEHFLATHPDFSRVDMSEALKQTLPDLQPPCPDPYLALTPAQHNTDGFFAAVMKRSDKVNAKEE